MRRTTFLRHPLSTALRRTTLLLSLLPALALAEPVAFNIPAQPLGAALNQLAEQSGLQVIYNGELVQGLSSPGVSGSQEPEAALQQLLQGSGLIWHPSGQGSVVLERAPQQGSALELGATAVVGRQVDATSEGTNSYAASRVTLGKGVQSQKDIPQSISVVTRKQMDDQRLDTLTDVLANTPGISLVKRPNGGNDIYSRGFLTETLQYDGVPLLRYHNWGNSLSASAVHLDRVEVLRGAQGLLEGSGNPAGAVNLVRKRGLADAAFTIEGRAGSWDNYGSRIDTGGPLNDTGTIRSRAVIDYEDRQSFIDTLWDRNINGYAALDFDLSPDTTVGLGVAYARLNGNSTLYSGVSRYANGHSLNLPRSANLTADWNEATRRETQVFVDVEHRLNDDWTLKATGAYARENYEAIESHANGFVAVGGQTVVGPGFIYDDSATSKGLDVNLTGTLQVFDLEHDVVVGGNYSKQNRDDGYSQYWNYTTYDVFDPRNEIPRLDGFSPSDIWNQTAQTKQNGFYAMLRTHLTERTTVILGGRVSQYEFASNGLSSISGYQSISASKESGEVTPYAGLVYALTPQWSAYASYAEIFQPQTVTDAQRAILPPMTGEAYEAGIKGELFDGALNTSLAIYRVEQNDRAVTDYDSPMVCDGWYCSRAAGKVRSEGFELEAHGELAQGWQVSGGYTYNRNEYLDDSDSDLIGKPFDYGPKHIFRLWSDYQLPGEFGKWRVGGGVNYRSEQKTDSATRPNPVQGGYSIWNAMLAYRIDNNWTASVNVDNVFDKHYYSYIAKNYFYSYVGEPRNFTLVLRGSF